MSIDCDSTIEDAINIRHNLPNLSLNIERNENGKYNISYLYCTYQYKNKSETILRKKFGITVLDFLLVLADRGWNIREPIILEISGNPRYDDFIIYSDQIFIVSTVISEEKGEAGVRKK